MRWGVFLISKQWIKISCLYRQFNPLFCSDETLGVETLAGCQCFVFLDEREQVERHMIISHSVDELKVVAAPRDIRERIIYDGRQNIHVLLEHGSRIDGKRSAGFISRQRLNGVIIKKVHNNANLSAKLWTV